MQCVCCFGDWSIWSSLSTLVWASMHTMTTQIPNSAKAECFERDRLMASLVKTFWASTAREMQVSRFIGVVLACLSCNFGLLHLLFNTCFIQDDRGEWWCHYDVECSRLASIPPCNEHINRPRMIMVFGKTMVHLHMHTKVSTAAKIGNHIMQKTVMYHHISPMPACQSLHGGQDKCNVQTVNTIIRLMQHSAPWWSYPSKDSCCVGIDVIINFTK